MDSSLFQVLSCGTPPPVEKPFKSARGRSWTRDPKKDEEIHQALEKWVKGIQALESMGVTPLPSEYKITSLHTLWLVMQIASTRYLSHAQDLDFQGKTESKRSYNMFEISPQNSG